MSGGIDHSELQAALTRCGSAWHAGQVHGLICGRLAVTGASDTGDWLEQLLQDSDAGDAPRQECASMLGTLYGSTRRQLSDRQSDFEPLLPGESASPAARAKAMAQWCEGFLHGLVAAAQGDAIRQQLAAEPLSEIIRDLVEISRATVTDDADEEEDEAAYAELVEYLRVAAQLAYEALAEARR